MRRAALLFCAATLAITPAAAQRVRSLDPQDVAEAQRENAQLIQELGGAETCPRAAYVESIGRRVGRFSGVAKSGQTQHIPTRNYPGQNAVSVARG